MDWIEFLEQLDKAGWGVLNFNTYLLNGENHFYLCVAERGSSGRFIKAEGKIAELPNALSEICNEVTKEKKTTKRTSICLNCDQLGVDFDCYRKPVPYCKKKRERLKHVNECEKW